MEEIDLLKKKLQRERLARKQAEMILESKALELFNANESLRKLNENLEDQILERTKALQESEIKYRNVIDQATDIIFSTDEDGYFTFINPIGSKAFGYSQDEIIGKRYIDFVPEEYKEQLFQYYTKIKDEKKASDYFEFPICSKSGQVHWIGQNVNRIVDQKGVPHYNAVARDISLRKEAEKELELAQRALTASEVKYRSVLENMELGLMEVDLDGRIVRVYDRFCAMTGYSKEELLGKDAIETVLVAEFKDTLLEQDQNRKEGQSGVYEVQLKRKDGKRIWVLISGAPFYNEEGEVIGSLGIHYDISDRKELARNLEIARAKAVKAQQAEQNFLANMSHEIRTPLNAIIGMTHLLKDSELDGKQLEYIDILDTSASLLKGLVSDILDISKIDSGMAEINLSTFDLKDLAIRLIKTFEIRSQDKAISLEYSFFDGKGIIKSDRQWINQILINLISNAVKFTSEGSVRLTIKRTSFDAKYASFYFEVEDTGIGMSPSEIESIFTAFKQANTSVRKDYGGSGLGLAIASRLVNMLGGELEVISELGQGSKFFFTLTFSIAEQSTTQTKHLSDLSNRFSPSTEILIVEDNYMNQKYIASLLDKWNIKFTLVDNGKQAVEIYQVKNFDLIFMDLSMPVMDGYDATKIIRERNGAKVPIIALTASTFLSKRELALKAGMSDFLAKPFTPEDLFEMLQKYIGSVSEKEQSEASTYSFSTNLDDKVLESLYGNDFAYAADMFETYLEHIDKEEKQLREYMDKGAKDSIKSQIHKMKPMFSMVGLSGLSNVCEHLEQEIFDLSKDEVQRRTNEIIEAIASTKKAVYVEYQRLQRILNQSK